MQDFIRNTSYSRSNNHYTDAFLYYKKFENRDPIEYDFKKLKNYYDLFNNKPLSDIPYEYGVDENPEICDLTNNLISYEMSKTSHDITHIVDFNPFFIPKETFDTHVTDSKQYKNYCNAFECSLRKPRNTYNNTKFNFNVAKDDLQFLAVRANFFNLTYNVYHKVAELDDENDNEFQHINIQTNALDDSNTLNIRDNIIDLDVMLNLYKSQNPTYTTASMYQTDVFKIVFYCNNEEINRNAGIYPLRPADWRDYEDEKKHNSMRCRCNGNCRIKTNPYKKAPTRKKIIAPNEFEAFIEYKRT